jgi:hypothetical protein
MEKQEMGMSKVAGGFLIVTVLLPWGFSLIGADREPIIGKGMICVATAFLIYIVWGADRMRSV